MGPEALDANLDLLQAVDHGLISTSRADEFGISARVLRRLVRDGQIMELATGVHVDRGTYVEASDWNQFDLRSRAWTLSGRNDGHACDFSAAAVLGFPMWGDPPDLPRVLRPGSAHRGHSRTPHGRVRYGWLPGQHQWQLGGSSVTSAAYASVDVIRMGSRLQGLTVADYALAVGIHREVLANIAENLCQYKGMDAVRWILPRADGRAESPLESAGRLVCLAFDLPTTVPNAWIVGGRIARRVDLLIPEHGIILEADGALKYNNRPDAARVVGQQTDREGELRDLGFDIVRFDAGLALARPGRLAGQIRRAMTKRRGRSNPSCWSLDPPAGWPPTGLGAGWPVPRFLITT
ncbi:hypothetical protein ABIB25_000715 [Nakamurella sp. UYEF19]|uniref:type IV toxin-antitoxin system AbiEi family antitoxin domain-containing protein n=1 Tax=Nakamurella sp. UYEF19 TaxID=1756392 RepID=UPI003392AECB